MNPRAFLALAKRLLANEKNPEGMRNSVGRAYYAAFNVTAEFLSEIGHEVPRDANGHKKAYYFLNNCSDTLLVQAGGDLDDLRGERNAADYRMDKKHVEKEENVKTWVDVADEIISKLDACKNGPIQRRNEIAGAINDYRKKNGS